MDDHATIDYETKSYADLPKVGAWAYSEDPTTDIICICWGYKAEEIQEWWPDMNYTSAMPYELKEMVSEGINLEAHNVGFEYSNYVNVLMKKYGWPALPEDTWVDTMATCAYYSIPLALDKACRALGFEGKDPAGDRLITKYSKLHLKTAKKIIPPGDFKKFVKYCKHDVKMEQSLSDYLGDLPDREIPVFQLDQTINRRGIYLDQEGIDAATNIVTHVSAKLTKQFKKITGFNPGQHEKVKGWFAEQGLVLENMQKDYLQGLLDGDGDEGLDYLGKPSVLPQGIVREAIELRLNVNKASTKKLDAMSRQRGLDGRAHYQTVYHGASTGRWTGKGIQVLNMNKGYEDIAPEDLVEAIMTEDAEWLDMLYGSAMDAVGKATRHWIQAQEGSRILAGDFVSIEAVILAVQAGEQWKVDAFANGEKLYERMGEKIHKLPVGTVTKKTHPSERFDGKTGELAFGYQGALGAWLNFDKSGRHTDERIIEICRAWRDEHPETVKFWAGLQSAAIEAVRSGNVEGYRDIGFEIVDDWLSMILPNGKRLWYFRPQVRTVWPHWHKPKEYEECFDGTCRCNKVPKLFYMSYKDGQWKSVGTYGGKLVENAVQATSRELLVPAMLRVEKYGYPIILSVYDEIVSEVPIGHGSQEEFTEIMSELPRWAEGWPVSVDAWEGDRYRK